MPKDFDLRKTLEKSDFSQERTVEFAPEGGQKSFKVTLRYVSDKAWRRASNALNQVSSNPAAQKLASDKKFKKMVANAITGWEGVDRDLLLDLLPLDPADVPESMESLAYSADAAKALVDGNSDFSLFVFREMGKLASFRASNRREAQKNLHSSPGGTSPPDGPNAETA